MHIAEGVGILKQANQILTPAFHPYDDMWHQGIALPSKRLEISPYDQPMNLGTCHEPLSRTFGNLSVCSNIPKGMYPELFVSLFNVHDGSSASEWLRETLNNAHLLKIIETSSSSILALRINRASDNSCSGPMDSMALPVA